MRHMNVLRNTAGGGFTLVEMLVVLVIIGILAALTLAGAYSALNSSRNAAIGLELGQLERAMKELQTKYSAYPPDFTPPLRKNPMPINFRDFVIKAWPRFSRDPSQVLNKHWLRAEQRTSGNPTEGLDQAEALVFWLGGYSHDWLAKNTGFSGSKKLYGFRADSTNPFVKPDQSVTETGWVPASSFQFRDERLMDKDNDGWYEYYPPKSNAPYVYFEAHSYDVYLDNNGRKWAYGLDAAGTASGYVGPYGVPTDRPNLVKFANPDSFQIISAGLDHEYGIPGEPLAALKTFPSGVGYTKSDEDNIANFSENRTLGDSRP